MPNFADKVKRLEKVRLLLRKRYGEALRVTVTNPAEHALRAIVAEEATEAQADEAMRRLHDNFVDYNDLRVSRPREIRDTLGASFPRSGHKARVIPRLLDQVFKDHNSMVWDFLEQMAKVQARAYFEKLEEVRPFVAAVLARDCVGAHAIPVDNDISRVLGRLAVLAPATQSEAEMQVFLERAVKANRAYEVHWLIKRLGEDLCIVGTPLCDKCPLNAFCPSAVLAPRGKKGAKPEAKAEAKKPEPPAKSEPKKAAAPSKAKKSAKPAAKAAAPKAATKPKAAARKKKR